MNQLTLFGGTAEAVRPLRPTTAMLLAMDASHSIGGPTPAIRAPRPASLPADAKRADTLRNMADGLQSAIDGKFADRETNTPKRQRQAGEARNEGSSARWPIIGRPGPFPPCWPASRPRALYWITRAKRSTIAAAIMTAGDCPASRAARTPQRSHYGR
jgi:hypothetical protein